MVHGRAEGLRLAGDVHQAELEVHHQHRPDHGDQEDDRQRPPAVRHHGPEDEQDHAHADRGAQQGPVDRPVRQLARDPGAGDHAQPEGQQEDGHRGLREPGDVGQRGGDVGVDGEHAAEADRAGEQREPHLRLGERGQLAASGGLGVAGEGGHPDDDHRDGHQREPGDGPVRRAPAEVEPQPGGRGHADHVGDRQPEHDQRHGAALASRRGQAGRHQGRDAEVGAVREAVEEPGHGERVVAGRQRAGRVEDRVGRHQRDQQAAARPLRPEEGQHRGAHDHAHGVRRDDVAGDRDRGVDAVRDLREQSHRHELGGADREPAHRQGEDREGEVRCAAGAGVGGGGCSRRHDGRCSSCSGA